MANSLLTISMLANIGCAVGIDMGFNACAVVKLYAIDKPTVVFTFGDQKEMRRHSLSRINECAIAYDESASCIREQRVVELPQSILEWSMDHLRGELGGKLLELIPSGPAGIKSNLFELVEQ